MGIHKRGVQKKVNESDCERLKNHSEDEIRIFEEHASYQEQYLEVLKKFEYMHGENTDWCTVAKHLTERILQNGKLIYGALFCATGMIKKFERIWISKRIYCQLVKMQQRKWAAPFVFASKYIKIYINR